MKIGIDATVVAQRHIVGISRFVVNLALNLAEIAPANEYVLCYRARILKRPHLIWRPPGGRFRLHIVQEPFNRRFMRGLQVYHATYQKLPRYRDLVPYLGTLHDIFYVSQPAMCSPEATRRWEARYRDVAARARLVMTLSEFSKSEIVRLLGVDPDRLRVVPLAAAAAYAPQPDAAVRDARRRYGLDDDYVLFGGGFDPRKNAVGALRAFAAALPRLPDRLCLAISGSGAAPPEAQEIIRQAGLDGRVRFLGFVPDAHYPALMAGSLLYFFPTLFEGFGLPALEAMSCGAPVLTSSTTSLPEVCGDAALLVDPMREAQMADALAALAGDPRWRAELRRKGLERARAFTWRRVAETVLGLYREVAHG